MFVKGIIFCGQHASLACDGKCNKAWGISGRPRNQLSDNEDDYEYLSDMELEDAPLDPGTYEGGCAKPAPNGEKLNKWCARECERAEMVKLNELAESDNFDIRLANIRNRQEQQPTAQGVPAKEQASSR